MPGRKVPHLKSPRPANLEFSLIVGARQHLVFIKVTRRHDFLLRSQIAVG